MPIESISRLLGHTFVATTQRYTSGANPDLRDEFQQAMGRLEDQGTIESGKQTVTPFVRPPRQEEKADLAKLESQLKRFDKLPAWLRDELCAYVQYRWRSWKPHLAYRHATRLTCQCTRAWAKLLELREISGWADLQRSDVEAWLDSRRQAGLSPSSQYTELTDLRAFLQFVQKRDHPVSANVFRIEAPVVKPAAPKHLTEAEYQRLLETVLRMTENGTLIDIAERSWFLTLAHTGVRVGELPDLRLSDLDLAGGRIFIPSAKNGQERVVYLTPVLVAALQRFLSVRPVTNDDHVWQYNGRRLTDEKVRSSLARWGKQCDISVTPHRLRQCEASRRDTFATRLLNQGVSLEVVRKLLGHSSLQMSQHYARLYDSTVKDQFESAAGELEGVVVRDWPPCRPPRRFLSEQISSKSTQCKFEKT